MAENMVCEIEGCCTKARSRGMCNTHYQRFLKHGDPGKVKKLSRMESDSCAVEGCSESAHAKGYCSAHYSRFKRYGSATAGAPPRSRNAGKQCYADGCDSPARFKGLCAKHYQRVWKYGDPEECRNPVGQRPSTCSLDGCSDPHHAHGYCAIHAGRYAKYGDPSKGGPVRAKRGVLARWIRDHKDYSGDECLSPPFGRKDGYYSQVNMNGENIGAHRYMCILSHGDAPNRESVVAHSCGNGHKGCVNPRHLRWASHTENNLDKWGHGTMPHGERQYNSKLTRHQVRKIRALRHKETQVSTARRFGIAQPTVSAIQLGRGWAWLD